MMLVDHPNPAPPSLPPSKSISISIYLHLRQGGLSETHTPKLRPTQQRRTPQSDTEQHRAVAARRDESLGGGGHNDTDRFFAMLS